MLKKILFLSLILYIMNRKNKVIEGIKDAPNCCKSGKGFDDNGTIPSNLIDSRCSSSHKYHCVKRCMGPADTFDCGSECNLCNEGAKQKDPNATTYGNCIPTLDGGYCLNNNEFKIYDTGEWSTVKKEDRGKDIRGEEHSKDVYKKRFSQECNPFGRQAEYEEDEEEDEEETREEAEEAEEGEDEDDLEIGSDYVSESPDYMKMGLISSLITISMIGLVVMLYFGYKNKNKIIFQMNELFTKLKNKMSNKPVL